MLKGIFFNIKDEDYFADPALSRTDLKRLLEDPYKFWYYKYNKDALKQEETPAMKFGSALHCYILEGECVFNERYIVLEGGKRVSLDSQDFLSNEDDFELPKSKTSKTAFYKGDKIVISKKEFEKLAGMVKEVRENNIASNLFSNGMPEVAIFWTCKETGLNFKVKHDFLRISRSVDYKTISHLKQIRYHFDDYGYDIQAYMYLEAIKAIKPLLKEGANKWINEFIKAVDHNNFDFVFQEKEAPYLIDVVQPTPDILENGKDKFDAAVAKYKACKTKFGEMPWREETMIKPITLDDLPQSAQFINNF